MSTENDEYNDTPPDKQIIIISDKGAVHYDELLQYEDGVTYEDFPPLEEGMHGIPSPRSQEYIEGNNGGAIVYELMSTPSIAILAGLIRAYILRHKNRSVSVSWEDGRKASVEIKGDFSAEEIAALLRSEIDEGSD